MLKTILCGVSAALVAGVAAPAAAQEQSAATCDAKYYGNLVGKPLDEARSITASKYRVVASGAARASDSSRMTIVYNPQSRRIVDVTCG